MMASITEEELVDEARRLPSYMLFALETILSEHMDEREAYAEFEERVKEWLDEIITEE